MIRGNPHYSPQIEDPDEPDYWDEQDFAEFRVRVRKHFGLQVGDAGVWREEKHPRGQPKNKGQFGPGGGGSSDKETKRAVSSAAGLVKRARAAGRTVAEQHSFEGGGAPRGAAIAAAEPAPAAAKPKGAKKASKIEDFEKAKIRVSVIESERDGFLKNWDEKIGMDPEEFKSVFLGGVPSTMSISAIGSRFDVGGSLLDAEGGRPVGTYDREIYLDDKRAYSAFFKIEKGSTDHDIGKKVLAGNIEMYERLGITEVGVTANIDVGGYAWAKYGYVPTQDAWNSYRQKLASEIGSGGGALATTTRGDNTMEAEEWSWLSEEQQDEVRGRWMRESRDEVTNSEIDSWRENGGALEEAKYQLRNDFTNSDFIPDWADEAINELRDKREEDGEPPIPYRNQQIFAAMSIEYQGDGEGGKDPDFEFDDSKLDKPDASTGYDPDQMTFPGIEPINPATYLTPEMREQISDRLVFGFNSKADNDVNYIDPPDMTEQVEEYQEAVWEDMDDRERLRVAERYDMQHVPVPESDEEEEEEQLQLEEKPKPEVTAGKRMLEDIVKDANPKAMWEFADTPGGKELLLKLSKQGYSWRGKLNLKDAESYQRFKSYVGRAKGKQSAAA